MVQSDLIYKQIREVREQIKTHGKESIDFDKIDTLLSELQNSIKDQPIIYNQSLLVHQDVKSQIIQLKRDYQLEKEENVYFKQKIIELESNFYELKDELYTEINLLNAKVNDIELKQNDQQFKINDLQRQIDEMKGIQIDKIYLIGSSCLPEKFKKMTGWFTKKTKDDEKQYKDNKKISYQELEFQRQERYNKEQINQFRSQQQQILGLTNNKFQNIQYRQ